MKNNQSCRVAEIDRVKLRLQDETVRIIGQVRHISDLRKNLISLSTLDSNVYKFSGGCGVLKVQMGVQIVLEMDRKSLNYTSCKGM